MGKLSFDTTGEKAKLTYISTDKKSGFGMTGKLALQKLAKMRITAKKGTINQ